MTNTMNIDQIADLLDLNPFEKLEECNLDYVWERGATAAKEYADENPESSEDDQDTARYDAEAKVQGELFSAWHGALMEAAERTFGEHGMTLEPVKVKGKVPAHPFEYRIKAKSWHKAADLVRDTVNGVGYFYFTTRREFLASGPYTAKSATLEHLHYLKRRSEVYGDASPKRTYERALEHSLRYL